MVGKARRDRTLARSEVASSAGEQRPGQYPRGSHGVLDGEVDADPADR